MNKQVANVETLATCFYLVLHTTIWKNKKKGVDNKCTQVRMSQN